MAKDSFKIKKSLHLKPTDSSEVDSPEVGDIIVDSSDDNKLKLYADGEFATIAGSGGAVANFFSDFDKLTPTLVNVQNDVVLDDAVVFLPIDDNKKSKKITYTAAGSALYEVAASADLEGAQGLMTIWIKTDVQGVTVSTTTDGVKQSTLSVLATGKWKQYEIPYVVGGTNQGLIVESANAGDVNIDEPFVGLAPAGYIQDVGQAQFVGSLNYDAENCIWATTSATYNDFPVDADCNASNITGNVSAPDTKIPAIKIPNVRTDGHYQVTYNGLLYSGTDTTCRFSLSSSSDYENQAEIWARSQASSDFNRSVNTANGSFKFNSSGDKEIRIIAYKEAGSGNCSVYGSSSFASKWSVHFFPDASSTIVTQDAGIEVPIVEEWQTIDATVGTLLTSTGSNPSYGTMSNNVAKIRRVGSNLELEWDFLQTSAGSGGSGIYLINLPNGLTIDTSIKAIDATTVHGDTTGDGRSAVGLANFGFAAGAGESISDYAVIPYSNTQLKVLGKFTTANGVSSSDYWGNFYPFNLTPMWGSIRISVPIQGWSSTETKDAKIIGKFEQIEEVKADLTAATANEFAFKINQDGSFSGDSYGVIQSCTGNGSSTKSCTFNSNIFSVIPTVTATGCTATDTNASVLSISTSGFSIETKNLVNSAVANRDICVVVHKQGADVNKSFVGAVISSSQSAQEIANIVRTQIVSSDLAVVEGFGNGGQFITANTDKIVFNETKDNQNAWSNNNLFTAPKDGYYLINGSIFTASVTSARIESYINNTKSKLVGEPDSGTTLIKISSIEFLSAGQTLDFRSNINITLSSNDAFHNIVIQELPDTESIVKNLLAESSQTKCQTKVLSSSTSTTGIVSGLTFNNLVVGKKYSMHFKQVANATSTGVMDSLVAFEYGSGTDIRISRIALQTNSTLQNHTSYTKNFTASESTVQFNLLLSASSILFSGTTNGTEATLCQLPDTVIDTDEW